jgi:hypothetical protein
MYKGDAGTVDISAKKLNLDNGLILTTAKDGNGGPISIKSSSWINLHNGKITTAALGNQGKGGDIQLTSNALIMNTGLVQTQAEPKLEGGKINLAIQQLIPSGGKLITGTGNETLVEFTPNSGINLIQSALPDGITGNISPQLNITGALIHLKTPQLDANRLGQNPCSQTIQQSTVKKLGKGNVPLFHKGNDAYTIDRLLAKPATQPSPRKQTPITQPECQAQAMQPTKPNLPPGVNL